MSVTFDFTGMHFPQELKRQILECLSEKKPFALRGGRNVALFIPEHLLMFHINNTTYFGNSVTKSSNMNEFMGAIGVAALGHREFVPIPHKALEYVNRLNESSEVQAINKLLN